MDHQFSETGTAGSVVDEFAEAEPAGGPPYVKLLRSVRYRRGDGLAWAAAKLRRSTSDRGERA